MIHIILGMSALLTTTMPYMGVVIEDLEKRQHAQKSTCDDRRCAPVNQEFRPTRSKAKRFMGPMQQRQRELAKTIAASKSIGDGHECSHHRLVARCARGSRRRR